MKTPAAQPSVTAGGPLLEAVNTSESRFAAGLDRFLQQNPRKADIH
jgi:hypothetical protein